MASTPVQSRSPAGMPAVLLPLALPALLEHILAAQTSTTLSPPATTLLVCSAREEFLQGLFDAVQQDEEDEEKDEQEEREGDEEREDETEVEGADAELGSPGQFITPTLHSLFTARHVKIAFCSSVQHLLAYLAACSPANEVVGESTGKEMLILVNPLSLHAPTTSFSAQGLSRTFAATVEAAFRLDARLWMVECQGTSTRPLDSFRSEGDDEEVLHGEVESHEDIGGLEDQTDCTDDPWEQEVSILNTSARRIRSGDGDRAWAGRTVKIRRIAARWFNFHHVDEFVSLV